MKITRRNQIARSKRNGAVTVELAMILPVIFTMVFGIFEFSRMNMIRNTSKNAAYKAARTAIVPGAQASTAISAASTLMQAIGVKNSTITVSPNPIPSNATSVTVTIVTQMNGNMFFTPMFLKNKSYTATCTLNREDY
ncbi:MAG: TadE/TadG family type IV pilus assembly protein [Planctomycetales bacterium]